MIHFRNVLVLLSLVVTLVIDSTQAQTSLSLDEAVQSVIKRDPSYLGAIADREIVTVNARRTYSQILPTVKIGRIYTQQDIRYHDNGRVDDLGNRLEDPGISRRKLGQNYLDISQKIPNPFHFSQELAIAHEQRELANLRANSNLFDAVARLQVQYFRVLIAQRSFTKGELHLQLASKDLEIAKQRFAKGFIQGADLRRSEINFSRVESRIAQLKNQLRIAEHILVSMVNGTVAEEELVLSTQLPESFAFERVSLSELQAMLQFSSTIEQQIAEREAEIARHELRIARLGFIPEIELGIRFNKAWPRERDFQDPAGPEYRVAAAWELFNGGRDYFTVQAKIENLSRTQQQLAKASDVNRVEQYSRMPELETLKTELKMQRQNLSSLKEIVGSSRQKFAAGLMTSREANQDFRDYLDQEEALLEVISRTISTVAEVAATRQDSNLFTKLIFGLPKK